MIRYAVVQVGSHQYRVTENSTLEVERFQTPRQLETGSEEVRLDQVLLVGEGGTSKIGRPFVPKASVICDVLGEARLPKVISFKFKRRKGYKRKKGHRQTVVRLRVKSIQTG